MTFSIEQNAESIYHPKTKEYFKEVLQSYTNESYRSAIVMLYSVVMCDLIYKLKDLKELYDDTTAKDILEKLEKAQEEKPNRSDWEIVLIEEVKERTLLLEPTDKISLDALRLHRHLSAHPVLTQQDLLSTPNKETVRALMRNMLEGLLIKNPVMSKKVFDTILEDLANHKSFFSDDLSLEKYIESRYLKNTNERMINTIFKGFWGIVFNCDSDECRSNREINFRTLNTLFKRYKMSLLKYMSENPIPFNKFEEESYQILIHLTEFIGNNPEIYEYFEGHSKTKLKAKIEQKWSLKVRSPFLREGFEKHFEYLIDKMHDSERGYIEEKFYHRYILKKDEQELLFSWASENACLNKYYDLMICQLIYSNNFNTADYTFDEFIFPNLKLFNREQFLVMYDGISKNRQCLGHKYAISNNTQIKKYSDLVLGSDFDYKEKFPNISFIEE